MPAAPHVAEQELVAALRRAGLLADQVRAALALAKAVHGRAVRDDGAPYLEEHVYPIALEVAGYALKAGEAGGTLASRAEAMAKVEQETERGVVVALLHDTLEDSPTLTAGDLRGQFGEAVAACVVALTKPPKAPDAGPGAKEAREQRYFAAVRGAPRIAQVVKVFDRLNNLACIHKSGAAKRRAYLRETRAFHLPLARTVDPALARRMEDQLHALEATAMEAIGSTTPSAGPRSAGGTARQAERAAEPLRVAVIGLGIGKTHLERYARLAGVLVVAVCDLDERLAAQQAAAFGCAAFADPIRLLDEAGTEAISLCTPPKVHPELTAAAAERGIHVLAEKPMASTVEGCDRMIEACRRAGVVLMIGHKKRFAPPFVRLLELTEPEGPLGPIRQVTAKYMHPGMATKGWFWAEDDGGGPVLENHVHAADTLGFLVGAPVRVYAEGASRFVVEPPMTSQPNVAGYTARFAGRDGASDAVVAVGYGMIGPVPGTPLGEEQWFFGCERGVAEVTGPFDNLQRLRWAERRREAPVHEEVWPDADPFLGELAHFVECVREGRAPRANGAAGRQAVAFCLAVKESIRTGAPVRLEGGE